LMKRREGKSSCGGFFFAKSQINNGNTVAAAKKSNPAFRKESWNTA